MKIMARICGVALLCTLAACGKVGPLEPKAGQAPPAKSYGQSEVPDSDTLMTPTEQARPGRSDELMRRSERRVNDPFDLPPGSEPQDQARKPEPPGQSQTSTPPQ
jgi:predicted small lipoprotein YifL